MSVLLENASIHVQVTRGQVPGITEVHAERCHFDGIPSDIVIVDTPSFYTYYGPDGEMEMKRWMDSKYTKRCRAAGVLYMHDLAFSPNDAGMQVSNHLGAFRHTCRRKLIPSVIHVVPTLSYGAKLSNKRIKMVVTQLRLQVYDEGAQLYNTSDGRPFNGNPETALDIVQGLLAALGVSTHPSPIRREISLEKTEIAENDYVIFVVGATGASKTRFTRQLNNCAIQAVQTARGRPHTTSNVAASRWNINNGTNNVVVVATPSFHTRRNGVDAENRLTDWLKLNFTETCHPAILFLHSLDADQKGGDMLILRHLETFAKAFPYKFTVPSRVSVVPTSKPYSTLPSEKLSQRLLELKAVVEALKDNENLKWRVSMFPGVFKGQREIAWNAALMLLKDISISQTQAKGFVPLLVGPTLKRMSSQLQSGRSALKELADRLFDEFTKKSTNGDLDAIITFGRATMEITPPEHSQHYSALINLARLLSERFNKDGMKEDLDEIITLRRTASECLLPDGPERQSILLGLDDCLYERFRREGAMADLEEIISLRRAALEHAAPPNRCRQLLDLANSLHEKFRKQGLVNDINEAVSLADTALGLCSPGHPDHSLSQDHLSTYLTAKVRKRGTPAHASDTSSSVSSDIKQLAKKVFFEKVEKLPLRLLHTRTGVLCNRDAQLSHFEHSPQYKQLLLSTFPRGSQELETEVNDVISEFFGFAMLSHRWGSGEPLLRDVEGKQIYDLGGTDGLAKLQDFCILALRRNFQWAWSDTCCIDKDSSAELQEAIGSMFSWYRQSSLTIVYLSDVFDDGSLANSVWFQRGWTLQELLASRTVLFYSHDWSLYKNSDAPNHKKDHTVLEELQTATGIVEQHLVDFYPGMDDARSRLHWASGRRTTRPEDIAYSLFGIFQVHLPIIYGETEPNALGRLLAEIISRSGDVSVLDWVGEASSFNSCFPASLVPYKTIPHIQPIPSDPVKRDDLDLAKAQKLYDDLAGLPLARCVNRRVTLPSTIHPVKAIRQEESSTSSSRYTYEIHASRLRPINIVLSVKLDESTDSYILVRPWHPKSLGQQENRDVYVVWKLLEQLEQPFNALLLKRSLHNEYKRIACDCTITACVQDLASVLDSEVLIPEIV
ncbi:hypothetical protein EDC04DRAFT_461665 [Pisolithus marmoratus]|nr:hypothetical protein EDC04DRAFT_461665 [Pisolithus marmoratus]